MTHDRCLVICGASLTTARLNKHTLLVAEEVRNELETIMKHTEYLKDAPFRWIGLMLRFGLTNEEEPRYQRIDMKDGELPVSIELDTHELRDVSPGELKEIFTLAALKTLVHAGKKFELRHDVFCESLNRLRSERLSRLQRRQAAGSEGRLIE